MHATDALAQRLQQEHLLQQQTKLAQDQHLLQHTIDIYGQKAIAEALRKVGANDWTRESLNRYINGKARARALLDVEVKMLQALLPERPAHYDRPLFRFIDLFAGIGGIRTGFDAIGGKCVFTSEWNSASIKTYRANHYSCPDEHRFNSDIRDVTLSATPASDEEAAAHIDAQIPDHQVLLAGFPCQPFSLAGVSKKNALGRAHGFACEAQGTLFFDVARIIAAKKPAIFVLENVKNLKSHDQGRTFRVIMDTLDQLGYDVANAADNAPDRKIIDARHFLPQHRERIVLVGIRRDYPFSADFSLNGVLQALPQPRPAFRDLLDEEQEKYILSPKLWGYLWHYAKKHKAKGNGFGFGLLDTHNPLACARTLSARYYKDGSEILIDRGWDSALAEEDFSHAKNMQRRPRRLTPRECARLMGFEQPGETRFRIPVSDTQAYKQFGNSVVVPVFAAVAHQLLPFIKQVVAQPEAR